MDIAKAFYAAVTEIRDGGIGEVEIAEHRSTEDLDIDLVITVRRSARPWPGRPPGPDLSEVPQQ